MPEVKIAAEVRTEFGKGPSRRDRRAGKVPAVMYGGGAEPRHLNLPGHDTMLALKTPNVLIRLEGLESGSELVLPKAVQRDPVKGSLEHVDLLLVKRGQKVTVDIPVETTGDILSGGILDQMVVQLTVAAEATHIPARLEIDVQGMEVGTAVHAKDLKLPAGVELEADPELLVLHVVAPRAEVAAEAEGAEGAEAAGAEGAAEAEGAE